ncbi:MAG: HD domain-containing protein, partial [Deltaproteobacteria bacterium]|nr:HD domain-containing protein [Deltaproteobacteria bacterium]
GVAAKQLADLRASATTTLELLRGNNINDFLFETSKEFVESSLSVLSDDRAALAMLAALTTQESSNYIYEHSLGVTLYSVMLGRVLGWKSSQNLFKLGLGALLHDIGASTIDQSILCRRESELKKDELHTLRQHPEWGAVMLKQLSAAPPEVLAIALQHHEELHGTGYPKKLDSTAIHPMAKLVGVANQFCELVLPGPASWNLSPLEAFEQMAGSNAYNGDILDALKRLLKGMP